MQVRDVMTPAIGSIGPDVDLRRASEQVKALDIDPLPVLQDGHVVGLLFERDVDEYAHGAGLATSSRHVSDVMRTNVLCCLESETIGRAIERIEAVETPDMNRRIPVVDDQQRLVGLVALADLHRRETGGDELTTAGAVSSIDQRVTFDEDKVDYMSDGSFPASDPLPPPTTIGPDESAETDDTSLAR